jgi:plastocyanin
VFALLLFPEGKLASRARLPYWLFVTLIVTQLSLIAAQDHTVGLVMIFGVFIPLVALSSQVRRYRTAATAAVRQQSKVLLSAMAFALLAAVALVGVTVAVGGSGDLGRQTKLYEFHSPAAGEYFFRCDPHPDDMQGTVAFVDDGDTDNSVSVEASDYEFDKDRLTLAAGEPVKINFTNEDGDIHNVAIYRTRAAEQPVFVGELFSGEQLATVAFRIFRPVFTVIPIDLFIGILHFHLWDIDRLINRALVYGLVTALIGTIYVAGIFLFQRVLEPFIEGSVVAATISTLVATALFRPARRGIQEFVDRRFYRSRYDSYKTLEGFGSRLRREVELESVSADLLAVVKEAVQPSHVSLWLRESDRSHPSEPHLPEEEIEPIRLRSGGNPLSRNDSGTM